MSEANAVQLGTDELAAMVPGLKAEIEALKAGLPADKADALSVVEAKVEQIGGALNTLAEAFSQLDARLTGRVNDAQERVTQQANYLTEFAGKVGERFDKIDSTLSDIIPFHESTDTSSTEPREPAALVVNGVPVAGKVDAETGEITLTGEQIDGAQR